jgi:hypothetical protein
MRARLVGAVVLGATLAMTLSACTPGYRGQTGLMLGEDGLIYGVVHVCDGSVESFGFSSYKSGFEDQYFDDVVNETDAVVLGTPAEIAALIKDHNRGYFTSGTSGQAGVTQPLYASEIDLDGLVAGEVIFASYDDGRPVVATSSFEDFEQLSCDAY